MVAGRIGSMHRQDFMALHETKNGKTQMKLYWVTTDDHDEDWFIVASSSQAASNAHENREGYNPGDARAEAIVEIPESVPAEPGWPSEELLRSLGAEFLHDDQPRVVEIAGRKFCEGMLESRLNEIIDDAFEARGEARPNQTKKMPLH
jgi:hypothetical protein